MCLFVSTYRKSIVYTVMQARRICILGVVYVRGRLEIPAFNHKRWSVFTIKNITFSVLAAVGLNVMRFKTGVATFL